MCVITSTILSVAAVAATTLTAAASTAVTYSQISANKKMAAYQIEQSKKEAKNLEMEAAYERQEGIETARKQKLNSILNLADQKAKIAGNNIALSSDLVLNLENDNKMNSQLDALTTQKAADAKADSLMNKRSSLYQNAALTAFKSKLNNNKDYLQLGSSAVSSLNSLSSAFTMK